MGTITHTEMPHLHQCGDGDNGADEEEPRQGSAELLTRDVLIEQRDGRPPIAATMPINPDIL